MNDMPHNLFAFGSAVLQYANILFGIATLENPLDEVRKVVALTPEEIPEQEKLLLADAKISMPKIPVEQFDVLIVDQIGKNFSGPGMDPNVTGISGNPHLKLKPDVQRRVVLDISDESHGNAVGIGLADFSTKRAFDKIDFDAGYANNITSRSLAGGRIPIILKNDQQAVKAALYTCDGVQPEEARIIRIPNTLHIDEIEVSVTIAHQLLHAADIDILTGPYMWTFDERGNLF